MQDEPTVFVVDDDAAMRKSMVWLIQSVGLRVEAYASARAFLAALTPERRGCAVVDLRMPGGSGLDIQDELIARQSCLPIILISAYAEIPAAVRALRAGALDFIEKPFSDQHLLDRVREAIERNRELSEGVAQRAQLAERLARLTVRELEVMRAIVKGHANKVIAADLGISPKTVEVHRSRVMAKMRVDSVADLVRAWLVLEVGPLRMVSPTVPPPPTQR